MARAMGEQPKPMTPVAGILETLKHLLGIANRELTDEMHMRAAYDAQQGSDHRWTRVGCVLVGKNGKRIAAATNTVVKPLAVTTERVLTDDMKYVEAHAEVRAILAALRQGYPTQGATAYVTHRCCLGCLRVLQLAGVEKVIYPDPHILDRHGAGLAEISGRDREGLPEMAGLDHARDFEENGNLREDAVERLFGIEVEYLIDSTESEADAEQEQSRFERKQAYKRAKVLPDDIRPKWPRIAFDYSPENPAAYDHPLIAPLFAAARAGDLTLTPLRLITDRPVDCRAAGLLCELSVKAGNRIELVILDHKGSPCRAAAAPELKQGAMMLKEAEAAGTGLKVIYATQMPPQVHDRYLDARAVKSPPLPPYAARAVGETPEPQRV